MKYFEYSQYGVKKLKNKSLKKVSGGVPWWIPVGIGIAYNEINDIWESGGDNLKEAYKNGQEWARNV
ncbi:hypothetical protein NC796_11355 [Aliifodinibius sp. S!AR15-10]|uniref:hypothetical protein n=1 Tax=Aliifodinibius sp. S!AR15-10 TaxID=2950437 RepID=UPI002859C7AB|nr:hypothetical protein [Aliifodinibius sp. S!AR15-10]MDR8391743.1 hypothetical protein [Aliifodinibius sp. S!AR15-10]